MTLDVVELDASQARKLTDRIKAAADDVWRLLKDAHDAKAYKALGCRSRQAPHQLQRAR